MTTPDLSRAVWRKSSHSGGNGNCTEVAQISNGAAVRDSKDPGGPVLFFGRPEWARFIAQVQRTP